MAEIINGIFDENGNVKENVTPKQIDDAYDKLMNATDITASGIKADEVNMQIDNPENLKLSDEQVDEIADFIEENTHDDILKKAKEDAENSDLTDEAKKASVAINPVTGTAMMEEEFDPDDDSIRSIED